MFLGKTEFFYQKEKGVIFVSLFRKLTSVILSACMTFSVFAVGSVSANAVDEQTETYAQETIAGSAILHCWNWSFNNIKANLAEIAAAGYTAVQTSPVQPPKDYEYEGTVYSDVSGQWWKLYQPLGFRIAGDDESWLGTAAELTELCTEAEKYNIKVIVDVVANHLANDGSDNKTALSSQIDAEMRVSSYFHSETSASNDSTRYMSTHGHIGMPDLDTGNTEVQGKVLRFLNECIDCGVDGFRFDAAKHIELPTDPDDCKSDFWPNVINGVKNYADSQNKPEPYIYAEILGYPGADVISGYHTYMAITDSVSGDYALKYAYEKNAAGLADSTYRKGIPASDAVLWVESHDTNAGTSGSAGISNTAGISDSVIQKAWAIVGSRADSSALFFARSCGTMGMASTDTTWKSTPVAEVNKFKNIFDGQSEYLSYQGNITYNERGSKGVVIVKMNGAGQVRLNANKMADGTYTDHVAGSTFTVSNGIISGTVSSCGIAVVYDENNIEDDTAVSALPSKLYLNTGVWNTYTPNFKMYLWDNDEHKTWVPMTDSEGNGIYEAALPTTYEWTNVIFCRVNPSGTNTDPWKNVWNQTEDLDVYKDGRNFFTITDWGDEKSPGYWTTYSCDHVFNGEPDWAWEGVGYATALFTDCTKCHKSHVYVADITSSVNEEADTVTYTATANGKTNSLAPIALTELYLNPNSNWKKADAHFAAYLSDDYGYGTSVNLTDTDGDGYYSAKIPENTWAEVQFRRLNPAESTVWNQTGTISLNCNCYILTEDNNNWGQLGAWINRVVCEQHDYSSDTPVWSWADDYSTATVTFTCSECGAEETVTATVTSRESGDNMIYTAAVTFNGQPYTNTKTVSNVLYLVPNSNWKEAGARFALYIFNRNTDNKTWVDMVKVNDDLYRVMIPDGEWTSVQFVRMNPNTTQNSFDSGVKWNGTSSIKLANIPTGKNCYAVPNGVWNDTSADGTWSAITHREAYYRLSPTDRELYDIMLAQAKKIVNGEQTNTVFSITPPNFPLTWTAADLGLSDSTSFNDLSAAIREVESTYFQYDLSPVCYALLRDCPYEFYWFETLSAQLSYGEHSGSSDGTAWTVTLSKKPTYTVTMYVSSSYQGGSNTVVDSSKIAAVNNIVPAAAQAIVDKYANVSDYLKLLGYATEICSATNYNYEAAANINNSDRDYDAWQLVYVFDNNPDTKVVCEGYSKAFQYLCSLTVFDSRKVKSRIVTGDMGYYENKVFKKGLHMWNVVTMEDGLNYLVDVTNSDNNRSPSSFFLNGGTKRGDFYAAVNRDSRYTSDVLYFAYDSITQSLWGEDDDNADVITLSSEDYSCREHQPDEPVMENVVEPTHQTEGSYDEVVYCKMCGKELSRTARTIPAIPCTIHIQSDNGGTITVVNSDENGESDGMQLSDGSQVAYGTVLTITRTAKAGYTLVNNAAAETVTVADDMTITLTTQKNTYQLTVTAANGSFTANKDITSVAYGTDVTLTAGEAENGYKFIGWYQPNGKQLTADTEYTVNITSNYAIEARYQQTSGVVTFMSNGNVVSTVTKTADKFTDSDMPSSVPSAYYGYQFDKWSMTADDIKTALADGNVTVNAVFVPVKKTFTVTVYNGEKETPTETTYEESQWISATAETVEGKNFAYWTLDDNIICRNRKVSCRVSENSILRAVYTAEAVESQGTATLRSANYNVDTKKLTVNAYLTVPENAVIVSAGLVASSSANYNPSAELTANNAQFNKVSSKAVGKSAPVSYTWTKGSVSPQDVWYIRAHVSYKYDGDSETHEIYGELITVTAGCDYDYAEKGTASINATEYDSNSKKARFIAYLTVPENAVISRAGLVASSATAFDPTTTLLTYENAAYKKISTKAVGASVPVSYTWTKGNVNSGDTWYARAYLVYTLNGVEHTVYGKLTSLTA